MFPQFKHFLKYIDPNNLWGNVNIEFIVMKNFFWGGNIILGDLMTVEDFIQGLIQRYDKIARKPDLVIIPSSFLVDWGRDYTGKYYKEIERKTGLKIVLLKCSPILL